MRGLERVKIHVHVLSLKALKTLAAGYLQIGIALWKAAPVVFHAIATGFTYLVKGVSNLFKELFKL